jgi:Ca-activated chloride channel homolog
VRGAARRFLERVPSQTRVGLVAFSDAPHTVIAPTTDHGTVRDQIDGLEADGATATGEALATALETLRGRGQQSPRNLGAVILLSDGKRTIGRDPLEVARAARRLRVPVYTVALGEPGTSILVPGTSVVLPVPPDPEAMREVARTARGRFFAVDDADRLTTVYDRLGTRLGTRTEQRQITAAFAGAGALLLLLATALSVRRFGLLP